MEESPDGVIEEKYQRLLVNYKKLKVKCDELKESNQNYKLRINELEILVNSNQNLSPADGQYGNTNFSYPKVQPRYSPCFESSPNEDPLCKVDNEFTSLFPLQLDIPNLEKIFNADRRCNELLMDDTNSFINDSSDPVLLLDLNSSGKQQLELPASLNNQVRKIIYNLEQNNSRLKFRLQSELQNRIIDARKLDRYRKSANPTNDGVEAAVPWDNNSLDLSSKEDLMATVYEDKLAQFMQNTQVYAAKNALLLSELSSIFSQYAVLRRESVQQKEKVAAITESARRQVSDMAKHLHDLTEEVENLRSETHSPAVVHPEEKTRKFPFKFQMK